MELRVPFTGFAKVFFSSSRPLSTKSSVRKYGGYTEGITSELAMNHTNAKTCLSRGIGGLPNACCWGTLHVACTSRHRSSKVPRVILNWLSNWSTVYAGKIFSLKTLISVEIAPHMGCNRPHDRNEIIIWINETLFFQREVQVFVRQQKLYCHFVFWREIHRTVKGVWEWMERLCKTPINISHRSFRNFPESFGKWKTPCTFTRGSRNIFPWPLVKKG